MRRTASHPVDNTPPTAHPPPVRTLELATSWGTLRIAGGSRAGEGSVLLLPQLRLALDAGRPLRALVPMVHVVVSHGHADHLLGLAAWASQRQLQWKRYIHPENHGQSFGIDCDVFSHARVKTAGQAFFPAKNKGRGTTPQPPPIAGEKGKIMNKSSVVLLIAALFCVAVSASAAEYPVVLYHGVAHVAGLNGTKWRSEVFCSNAEPTAQNVKVELIPRGSTAVQAIKNLEVQPGATLFEGDIYAALEAPDGAGSLRVTGNVLCWVRTFNLDEAHHATYGATVPPYTDQTAYEASEEVWFPAQVAANVATGFRTNLLLYNPSNHGLHITVASGSTSKTYTVGSLQYIQISDLGSNMGLPVGPQTIKVTGDAPWWGYVSIIDPVSGDGATILGLKKPAPPLTVSCSAQ
jgi:hypothetical protein